MPISRLKGGSYALKRSLLKVAKPTGPVDHSALLEMCESMADRFVNVDLESFDTSELVGEMMDALRDSGFDVEPFLVNLGRGLITLEGTIHLISPKLNIMRVLADFLQSSFDPSRAKQKARRVMGRAVESAEAMVTLPAKAAELIDMVQKGHVKVGFEVSADAKLSADLRAIGALVALALVAMALIIGFCILGVGEATHSESGFTVTGLIGLLVGVAVAVYVIVRSRKFLK